MLENYLLIAKERCKNNGLEPNIMPTFTTISESELSVKKQKYESIIKVVRYFMEKFLSKISGIPLFVSVTDDKGVILEFLGDESLKQTIIGQMGIKEGVQFIEREAGINVVSVALDLQRPVQLLGLDHYHSFLHQAACYSAPFFLTDKKLVGTISIMTFIEHAHPAILGSLETVADSIGRELYLIDQNKYLDKMNEMILEQTNTGYIIVNKLGKITKTNPVAKQLLAKVDQTTEDILDLEELGKHYQAVMTTMNGIRDIEILFDNGVEIVIYLVDCLPFLEGVMIQFRDISDYKKAESYIQNAEKLNVVGHLAAGVAHEIKNPLTTLKGFMQLFQENEQNEGSHIPLILQEIERINQITSELLVLSRPTVHQKDWYDIGNLLLEIEVLLSSFAIEKNIEIIKKFEKIPPIYCNGNQLKQVFINLFKNSVEAVSYNGSVTISVHGISSDEIQIRFQDSGNGFSPHILKKVGQPFITTKSNGNGLGLMICKRIVETIHHGKFIIANNEMGKAVVDIILPVSSKEEDN